MTEVSTGSITIVDVTDGLNAVLSNESAAIQTDMNGDGGDFSSASTTMFVFFGATDDTAQWVFSATPSAGVSGDLVGNVYTVTNMTVDTGYVDLKAKKSGYSTLTKRFNIAKQKQGVSGAVLNTFVSPTTFTFKDGVASPPGQFVCFSVRGEGADSVKWYAQDGKPLMTDKNRQTDIGAVLGIPFGGVGDNCYLGIARLGSDAEFAVTAVSGDLTGVIAVTRSDVATGSTGPRGSMTVSYEIVGQNWTNALAIEAISNAGGDTPRPGDVVTLYNNTAGFSQTRVFTTDSVWVVLAAFFGGDVLVDGTIVGSKLVAGTIEGSRIAAGTITADNIAANAITTGVIAAGAVTADQIAANTITADEIAANAITADAIAADAVTSNKIAAGAIVASKIAAGEITTDKLAIGLNGNGVFDSMLGMGIESWTIAQNSTAGAESVLEICAPGNSWAGMAFPTLSIKQETATTSGYAEARNVGVLPNKSVTSLVMPCDAGQWVEASVYACALRCTGLVVIQWLDASGANINVASASAIAESIEAETSATNPDAWVRYGGRKQAPANTAYARIILRKNATKASASPASSYIYFHKPMLTKVSSGTGELSPYVASGMTYIHGNSIVTGTLKAANVDTNDFNASGVGVFGGELKSSNYVAGSAGWSVKQNGDAEFNQLVVRRDMIQAGTFTRNCITYSNVPIYLYGRSSYVETGLERECDFEPAVYDSVYVPVALPGHNYINVPRNPIIANFIASIWYSQNWPTAFDFAIQGWNQNVWTDIRLFTVEAPNASYTESNIALSVFIDPGAWPYTKMRLLVKLSSSVDKFPGGGTGVTFSKIGLTLRQENWG